MYRISEAIDTMRQQGGSGTLVIVTAVAGHTPQVVGAKMLVYSDGTLTGTIGGGRVEHVVTERALEVLKSGQPQSISFRLKAELGMCCGGQMEVYMEPITPQTRLIIFGAGHVAQPTAALAVQCGFEVWVVDERSDWLNEVRFPTASKRSVEPHLDFFASYTPRSSDRVVITTHNHDYDYEILERMLHLDVAYRGMIGSTKKVATTFKRLRLDGHSEALLKTVHAPIGLDIAAETPQEIAVSIMGELIRHQRQPGSRKTTRGSDVQSAKETTSP